MKNDLPAWAEAAIAAQGATRLRPRLIRRWREIEIDVLPALAGLDDTEKQWILDGALWAGMYWQREATDRHREAITAAKTRLKRIADLAADLAAHLNALALVQEEQALTTDLPSLWELLEAAAESDPAYLHWLSVMEGNGHWRDFIRTAQTQSRPGPDLADLLAALASSLTTCNGVYSMVQRAVTTHKAVAVPKRILITQLLKIQNCHLADKGFTLPDKAIATLAAVIFDLDPQQSSADAIKEMRKRIRNQ